MQLFRRPSRPRTGYPVRGNGPPLRVSTLLCLVLGAMALIVEAFTSLFAAI
jgi:hypothetical protein